MSTSKHRSLRQVAIFQDLPDNAIRTLEAECTWRTYELGEQIVGHLESSQAVFFVVAGLARVIIYSAAGKVVAFRDIRPGDMFGEFSAIDEEPRSATVEALQNSVAGSVSAAAFRHVLATESAVAMALLRHLVTQARKLTSRVYEFSTLAVQNRIHAELLRLARETGCESGAVRLVPSPTHALIAAHISTHREAVSRELSRLADIGLLRREGTTLCILDVEKLALMVEQAISD